MLLLHDPEAIAELGRKEGPDPGLEQDPATRGLLDQHRPAGEGDPVLLVGSEPA